MKNKRTISITVSFLLLFFLLLALECCKHDKNAIKESEITDLAPGIRKIRDIVIYSDSMFYSAFPSVIRRPDGELIVAFRRAPNRKIFNEGGNSHVDPNSYLVLVRSKNPDDWSTEPEVLYAHPFGGSQDPCLLQLSDGTLICTSYGWAFVRPDGIPGLKQPYAGAGGAIFLGGYLTRSTDGGKKWEPVIYPSSVPSEINFNAYGIKLPAYNRGALCESKDGRILWAVASSSAKGRTAVYLMTSKDKGLSWEYSCPIAIDDSVTFNETSLYETPMGDIVAFLRTAGFEDQACIARSKDGGRSFQKWESMGFQGHPLNALRLPDKKVLLTYGYRHKPYGIRARILNAECTDFTTAPEIILRDDGGNTDIGYTWPVMTDKNHILVTYYFNKENGIRHIAGTLLEITQ
ncbi:MAG TPA: sialidase family protein [Bacteroidales bacterium]|nr:sialidase family protein [Bacteroidales bacterium]